MVEVISLTEVDVSTLTIRVPKPVYWRAQPDITTFELAQAMPVLLSMANGNIYGTYIEDAASALPPSVQRHFVIGDNEKAPDVSTEGR